MGRIDDYVNGIRHDLESVIPMEGHALVKDSIAEQARRLGEIAQHNNEYIVMMMDEFFTMIENRYNIVDFRECDCWDRVSHEQLMKEFKVYLKWGLDAVDHFDD